MSSSIAMFPNSYEACNFINRLFKISYILFKSKFLLVMLKNIFVGLKCSRLLLPSHLHANDGIDEEQHSNE